MPTRYTGPAMTIDNMRSLGVPFAQLFDAAHRERLENRFDTIDEYRSLSWPVGPLVDYLQRGRLAEFPGRL
jgi:hypothetical protein